MVDETGLDGRYDLELQGSGGNTREFLQQLRDQLGLAVTPGRRSVTLFVVRKH